MLSLWALSFYVSNELRQELQHLLGEQARRALAPLGYTRPD